MVDIRDVSDPDLRGIVALNTMFAKETSLLDERALRRLLDASCYAKVVGEVDALLIALDQDASHDGINFRWFKSRYTALVYVDRIVVHPRAQGQGLARQLYADMFASASQQGHRHIGCEVNVDPPNPASDAFHAALGFHEVGRAQISPTKTVRYLVRNLSANANC
jgi:uncharacterized protein